MDVTATPKTQKLLEYDFHFLGGVPCSLTLRPELGDEVAEDPESYEVYIAPKTEPFCTEETITVLKRNILFVSRRARVVELVDPKNNPISQVVAENEARVAARKPATPAIPA